MAFCQSIIALVARLGLIDGSSTRPTSKRPPCLWHLRLAAHRSDMEHAALRGRSILVVEDEIIVAMDIVQALERAGANATMTTTVRHALILVEHDGLSAAIMDHALSDGDSTELCARLKARGIPYISYSGYDPVKGASSDAPHINKPTSMDVLMSAMEELLAGPSRIS